MTNYENEPIGARADTEYWLSLGCDPREAVRMALIDRLATMQVPFDEAHARAFRTGYSIALNSVEEAEKICKQGTYPYKALEENQDNIPLLDQVEIMIGHHDLQLSLKEALEADDTGIQVLVTHIRNNAVTYKEVLDETIYNAAMTTTGAVDFDSISGVFGHSGVNARFIGALNALNDYTNEINKLPQR